MQAAWDPDALKAASSCLAHNELDWDSVHRRARAEGLSAFLFRSVRGRQLVPPLLERAWRDAYYGVSRRNSLLLHELGCVLRAMGAQGVGVILLKGAALAEAVYGNPAVRPMIDLDLLVPSRQAVAAQRTLAALGFTLMRPEPWPGFDRRYRYAQGYMRGAVGALHYQLGLHWGLLNVPLYERVGVQEWFDRARPVSVEGADALVPAPEDHLVYLCSHAVLHHQGGSDLLRLCDVAMLIRTAGHALDWCGVVRRAVGWRLVIPVQRILSQLEELWTNTVPASVLQEVLGLAPTTVERRVHRRVTERPGNASEEVLLSLATLPGLGRRIGFLAESAIPSPDYMRRRYCPEHPGRWPLAYLQRAGVAVRCLFPIHGRPSTVVEDS